MINQKKDKKIILLIIPRTSIQIDFLQDRSWLMNKINFSEFTYCKAINIIVMGIYSHRGDQQQLSRLIQQSIIISKGQLTPMSQPQKAPSYRKNNPTLKTKFMPLLVFVLLFFIPVIHAQSTPAYSATPDGQNIMMRTDTKDAVLSLRSSSDPVLSFSISYSTIMAPTVTPPATTPKMVAVTSVSSFDCLASTEFSFNMSISSPALSGFTMQFQIFGNTYLNKLRFNYLAVAWDPAYTNTAAVPPVGVADILYNDCFLTSDLAIVTTTRSQVFTKQTLPIPLPDNTKTEIQSFITGLKFFNNKDVSKKVSVKSQILDNTAYITQTIQVTGNTVLEWICLGTVVIDKTYPEIYQQILPYDLGFFVLDRVSASIDMSTFPTNYLDQFDKVDNKFFGLIELELFLGKPYQIIKFLSDNIGTVQLGYESLASGGKMGYFFMSKRQCTPNTLLYSILDNKCYGAPCPAKTAQYGTLLICAPCHYSCDTCTGLNFNQCDTCDSITMLRDPVNAGECKCKSTYVDNGVPLCEKCYNFLAFCDTCTSKTVCSTCVPGGFILKTDSSGCQCDPVNSPYYVKDSNVCAPFPGCLIAQTNPNFASCTKCDTTLNFKEIPAQTCICMTNYHQVGGKCVDICGDGINPHVNSSTYCDDGNNNPLDGCDAACAVEPKYGCFNPPNIGKSFCSPVKTFTLKYLYAERLVSQNAGNFFFEVTPADAQLAASGFTYYVQTTIPHTTAIGTYDPTTSILKIKIIYTETIEDQTHDIHITLDPYVMSVTKQSFNIKSSGVNYDLTMEDSPRINVYIWYMTVSVSGIIVLTSLILTFINYKIAAVELLLSSQLVYMALLSWMDDNLSLYPLTGLKYLAGYNTLQMFEINRYNANTPFLLSSYTFAEFLLNLNVMVGLVVLVIVILIPLKINVWFRTFQRNRFTSPQMQQKLITEEPTTSLSEMSSKIKTAQLIADTYVDRVYFAFSLVVFLPIVLYFSIQLGFIGKVGRYELSSFANIMLSILLLMLDFCFFILIFQDTDKKLKTFNFGSKKLKSYPNRLMMFYFATCCLFTIVLLSEFTFYVLCGMTLITGIYTFVENPYEKISLEYVDSVSKPIIALLCQIAIKATTFFPKQIIFIPIGVDALLLISAIVTIVRVIRVKTNRAEAAKKMLEDAENDDDENADYEKNVKTTDESEYNSTKQNKKMNAKLTKGSQDQSRQSGQKDFNNKTNDNQNENDDSAGELNKDDSPNHNEEQLGEQEDELTRIKRSLRQDLKKRRGIVQKVGNDDAPVVKTKKPKSKKFRDLDFAEDKKNQ